MCERDLLAIKLLAINYRSRKSIGMTSSVTNAKVAQALFAMHDAKKDVNTWVDDQSTRGARLGRAKPTAEIAQPLPVEKCDRPSTSAKLTH